MDGMCDGTELLMIHRSMRPGAGVRYEYKDIKKCTPENTLYSHKRAGKMRHTRAKKDLGVHVPKTLEFYGLCGKVHHAK